ncbi:MAG TPA: 16S rRNA (guanine(966)-N(2))-methyltransferase RsmD [Abditibacteriaceae bacterium]|nr:16S rRNA (guanine(966)-N(2))-methyltransferase RsmD [Abditibacteriaceae bacterium]
MRILSGEAKGRTLKTRAGKGTRPTDSRAREMLFNILGERVIEARVLDLYAGSGAVGLEALSRGAGYCLFVEQNAGAAHAIRGNVRACGWGERATVWQTNMKSAAHRLTAEGARFDIIFADPPFTRPQELNDLSVRMDKWSQLLHNVGTESPALLIIQHYWKAQSELQARLSPRFTALQERRAGESMLSFFGLKPDEEAAVN